MTELDWITTGCAAAFVAASIVYLGARETFRAQRERIRCIQPTSRRRSATVRVHRTKGRSDRAHAV